jgi:hypothetical protein
VRDALEEQSLESPKLNRSSGCLRKHGRKHRYLLFLAFSMQFFHGWPSLIYGQHAQDF